MAEERDDFMDIMRHFDRIDDHRDNMAAEFHKLAVEPSATRPKVGDHVLVAAGLLNRGHLWIRYECEVICEADTSFKIRCCDSAYHGLERNWEQWVHQALITDVLKQRT